MNDQDLKEFEKWHDRNIVNPPTLNDLINKVWTDACLYKQKEIDELLKQLKHEHDIYKKHLKVYEDENTKLRLVVDHYANMRGFGAYAKIMLRELEGK